MTVIHISGRVGVTLHGIAGDRVTFWTRRPGSFRHFEVQSPVALSRGAWRYAIRHLGLRRALMARGFVSP